MIYMCRALFFGVNEKLLIKFDDQIMKQWNIQPLNKFDIQFNYYNSSVFQYLLNSKNF